jgi:hypothetical protein
MIYIGPDGRPQVHVDDLNRKALRRLRRTRKKPPETPLNVKNGTASTEAPDGA